MRETTAQTPAEPAAQTPGGGLVWMHGFPVPGRTADLARQAEDLGFDGLLLAECQNLVGDPFVELAVAAGATRRIGLGTGIVNLVTRHPGVVAAAIASVQVESRGRAVLGVWPQPRPHRRAG